MIDANEFITIFDDSNIERIVNHEYLYYLSDIQCKSFFINNVKIKWKRFPTVDEKDATFFHLITVGYKDRDTYCCPNRSIHCIRDFKYQPMMGEEYSLEQKRTICGFRIQSLPLLIKTFSNSKQFCG